MWRTEQGGVNVGEVEEPPNLAPTLATIDIWLSWGSSVLIHALHGLLPSKFDGLCSLRSALRVIDVLQGLNFLQLTECMPAFTDHAHRPLP